jgi:hypothetical protein
MPRRHRLATIAALLLATAALIAAGAPGLAVVPAGTPVPDLTATGPSPSDGSVPMGPDDGATLVSPDPAIVDLHPAAWDHIVVAADGRTLTVYFWGGVLDCYGLGKVDVTAGSAPPLTVTLWTGERPDMAGKACIQIAQLFKTVVTLDAPLIGGGAS